MNSPEKDEHWDLIIKPQSDLFDLHLQDVWRYRDLLILFVKRDFVAQYKQTILGPLWNLIQPILTTIMYLLVFGKIAHIPTDGIKPALFYMSGIAIWNYFSVCLMTTSTTFVANAPIFGKVYFPRLVIPLSVVISNLIRFGIQFGLLLGLMIVYSFKGVPIHLNLYWLCIPLIVFAMGGIGLGLGIIISSLTTKYRDLSLLLGFAVQLAMYITPVVYPLSFLSGTKYKWFVSLNPLTPVLEMFRFCIFGKGTVTPGGIAYSLIFMVVTVLGGILIFNRVEKDFMDTV